MESYTAVKAKFELFFVKKKNIIYERARFNRRIQEEGESVSSFISDLYSLAKHCGYGNLREELIRDRLVVGIRDARLSETLQLDSDLTLKEAVTSIHQSEMVHCGNVMLIRYFCMSLEPYICCWVYIWLCAIF